MIIIIFGIHSKKNGDAFKMYISLNFDNIDDLNKYFLTQKTSVSQRKPSDFLMIYYEVFFFTFLINLIETRMFFQASFIENNIGILRRKQLSTG